MGLKPFLLGVLFSLAITACGSIEFLYKFYVYNYEDGILQGPKPENDLKAEVCAFKQGEGFQCMVMKISDFYRLKSDYEKQKTRIQYLERNCQE